MKNPASTRGTTSLRIGVGAERPQGVDLIGDDHRSELGRDARPDAAGQHQPGEHRAELLDHRRADQPSHERPRAELIERDAGLQRQHGAGEEAGQQDDRERADADRLELLDDIAEVEGTGEDRAKGRPPAGSTYSCTSSTRALQPVLHDACHRLPARRQAGEAELAAAKRLQPVADGRGALEVQIGRRRLHLELEPRDLGIELGLRPEHVARLSVGRDRSSRARRRSTAARRSGARRIPA